MIEEDALPVKQESYYKILDFLDYQNTIGNVSDKALKEFKEVIRDNKYVATYIRSLKERLSEIKTRDELVKLQEKARLSKFSHDIDYTIEHLFDAFSFSTIETDPVKLANKLVHDGSVQFSAHLRAFLCVKIRLISHVRKKTNRPPQKIGGRCLSSHRHRLYSGFYFSFIGSFYLDRIIAKTVPITIVAGTPKYTAIFGPLAKSTASCALSARFCTFCPVLYAFCTAGFGICETAVFIALSTCETTVAVIPQYNRAIVAVARIPSMAKTWTMFLQLYTTIFLIFLIMRGELTI